MKRYKLLKDFPYMNNLKINTIPAGTFLNEKEDNELEKRTFSEPCYLAEGYDIKYAESILTNNPEWFEEVKEIKYYKRIEDGCSPFKVGCVISTDTLRLNLADWQETTKEEYDAYKKNIADAQVFYDRSVKQFKYPRRLVDADAMQGKPRTEKSDFVLANKTIVDLSKISFVRGHEAIFFGDKWWYAEIIIEEKKKAIQFESKEQLLEFKEKVKKYCKVD